MLESQIQHRDGWNLENRIETAMHQLNVPEKQRDIRTLSGANRGAWHSAKPSLRAPTCSP